MGSEGKYSAVSRSMLTNPLIRMSLIKCKLFCKRKGQMINTMLSNSKSVVLNYTEMEAKVHDATNNEAWGASSTAMQEIAQATHN